MIVAFGVNDDDEAAVTLNGELEIMLTPETAVLLAAEMESPSAGKKATGRISGRLLGSGVAVYLQVQRTKDKQCVAILSSEFSPAVYTNLAAATIAGQLREGAKTAVAMVAKARAQ